MSINFKADHNKIKFKCQQCGHCCTDSRIRLSPYDILKLCSLLDIKTTEFHEKYTYFILDAENQNLLTCMLKTTPECSFLSSAGCQVYSERPFGCRVFPLMVTHFFNRDGFAENKTYIVEECLGFKQNKKIEVSEFKEEQGVDELLPIQEEWVRLKVKVINSKIINKEEYDRVFHDICFDFEGDFFQNKLKEKGLAWPDDLDQRFEVIMQVAGELLLL